MALFELFSSCCKGPSGEEGGECRRPNPPAAAEWGMAEPQSPLSASKQHTRHTNLPSPPSQWRTQSPAQHPQSHITCSTRKETLRVAHHTNTAEHSRPHHMRHRLGRNIFTPATERSWPHHMRHRLG